jgi:hypothetical protein
LLKSLKLLKTTAHEDEGKGEPPNKTKEAHRNSTDRTRAHRHIARLAQSSHSSIR